MDKSSFDVTKLQVPVLNGLPIFDFAMVDAAPVRTTRSEYNIGQEANDDDVNTTGSTVTIEAKTVDGVTALQRLVCGYDPTTEITALQLVDDDVQPVIFWRSHPSGDKSKYKLTRYYGMCTSVVDPDDSSGPEDFLKGRFTMAGAPPISVQNGGVYLQLIDHTNGTGTLNDAFSARTGDLDALDVFAVKVESDGKRKMAKFANGGGYVTGTSVAVPIHTTAKVDLPTDWSLTFDYLAVVGIWTGTGTHILRNVPVTEMNIWSAVA